MQGGAYKAPVSHPERLGPIDFLSCTSMALATMDPSPETIANLEKAIAFHAAFERAERRIDLEEGRQLQAQGAPPHLMNTLRTTLAKLKKHLLGRTLDGVRTGVELALALDDGAVDTVRQELEHVAAAHAVVGCDSLAREGGLGLSRRETALGKRF